MFLFFWIRLISGQNVLCKCIFVIDSPYLITIRCYYWFPWQWTTFRISHCPSLWFSRKGSIHFIHSTSLTLVGLKHEQIFFPKQQKSRRELFYRQHMAKREANSWFSKDLQKSSAHWHVKQGAGTRCFTAPVCWWSTTESHFCLRLLHHSEACF